MDCSGFVSADVLLSCVVGFGVALDTHLFVACTPFNYDQTASRNMTVRLSEHVVLSMASRGYDKLHVGTSHLALHYDAANAARAGLIVSSISYTDGPWTFRSPALAT